MFGEGRRETIFIANRADNKTVSVCNCCQSFAVKIKSVRKKSKGCAHAKDAGNRFDIKSTHDAGEGMRRFRFQPKNKLLMGLRFYIFCVVRVLLFGFTFSAQGINRFGKTFPRNLEKKI